MVPPWYQIPGSVAKSQLIRESKSYHKENPGKGDE
jgi:hypothetical protein